MGVFNSCSITFWLLWLLPILTSTGAIIAKRTNMKTLSVALAVVAFFILVVLFNHVLIGFEACNVVEDAKSENISPRGFFGGLIVTVLMPIITLALLMTSFIVKAPAITNTVKDKVN